MAILNAFLLGIIQGITEFLPISSDGHLVIAQGYLPAFGEKAMTFDVMLHLGTLLAVVFYFRRELWSLVYALTGRQLKENPFPARRWLGLILVATIPTGVVGLALEKPVEALFSSPTFAAAGIFFNGMVLLSLLAAPRGQRGAEDISTRDALLIGLVQGLAVLPGISRSGNTIVTAMFLGIRGDTAAQFSFLLSIPAVAGAVLIKSRDLQGANLPELIPYGVGAAAACVTGLWAIAFLLKIIVKGKFQQFGYYCLAFGGGILLLRALGI